ncbi:DUF2795 domain-containing protein [Actinoallomurus spadix]|uniref:DUF2795 domain-containing protein n=1 Tax=Actinoallomurus spadix TaxID=79912 RepID=A0ABP3H1U7_9ACTN|nr:DUF2795 domain-containing protein [Actinoallomurus spadix]MCO5987874.1 DUF2795 domain-containing protein [Actinoallomurus spadix]
MGDQSAKHGPHIDDEMRHETEGLQRAGRPTHAEEWKETEPVVDDRGRDATSANLAGREGTPAGMSPDDVERRSDMARYLAGFHEPMRPAALADRAAGNGAPDDVVRDLRKLPDQEYTRVAEVSEALGLGNETRRA